MVGRLRSSRNASRPSTRKALVPKAYTGSAGATLAFRRSVWSVSAAFSWTHGQMVQDIERDEEKFVVTSDKEDVYTIASVLKQCQLSNQCVDLS